jgi:meso-butanediol dehydrogenase / (S,S)-butanediol dehydrogenase / diacetyl reductase
VSDDRFAGKVAVVTGGTTGIGRATVERPHAQGAAVCFCGRRQELGDALVAMLGERVVFVRADVTDRADLERLYATVSARLGRLDVLINNAGNVVVSPTLRLTPAHWRRTMALNLDAVFDSCQLGIPLLRTAIAGAAAHAAIVNVASLDAVGADRGFAAYNAAKAGVLNLTRSLALEFGPEQIRCNVVSPGAVDTPLSSMTTESPVATAAFEAVIPLVRARRRGCGGDCVPRLRRCQLRQRGQPAGRWRRDCGHRSSRPPRAVRSRLTSHTSAVLRVQRNGRPTCFPNLA